VAVTSSLTTTIMAATINEVSSTKLLPANDSGGAVVVLSSLPTCQLLEGYVCILY